MNWLEFLASIIDSLAWPVSLAVVLYFLKDNIISLVPYIQKVKYKDFELELKEANENFQPDKKFHIQTSDVSQLIQLAELSPRAAILESWLDLERTAMLLLNTTLREAPEKIPETPVLSPHQIGQFLAKNQLITNEQLALYNKLRELRNKAVHLHDNNLKIEDGIQFVELAGSLIAEIKP